MERKEGKEVKVYLRSLFGGLTPHKVNVKTYNWRRLHTSMTSVLSTLLYNFSERELKNKHFPLATEGSFVQSFTTIT